MRGAESSADGKDADLVALAAGGDRDAFAVLYVDPSGPPLATALQEQLGLKLESVRAPVDVLVIERAEPLSAPAR